MDRGAWWAAVHGVTRVGHDWATKHIHSSLLPDCGCILYSSSTLHTGSLLSYICASRGIFFSGIYSNNTLTSADAWYLRCQKGTFSCLSCNWLQKAGTALCHFQCIRSEKSSVQQPVGATELHRVTCPHATRFFHDVSGMLSWKFWWRRSWTW